MLSTERFLVDKPVNLNPSDLRASLASLGLISNRLDLNQIEKMQQDNATNVKDIYIYCFYRFASQLINFFILCSFFGQKVNIKALSRLQF